MNSGGVSNALLGGWQVAPLWRWEYGTPFSFYSSTCNVVPQFREGCVPGLRPGQQVQPHGRNGFNPASGRYFNIGAFETDFSAFEVGRNIATTPGKVVFENDTFQLIQYAPTTEKTYEIPLLIVPPWINKFYILDLNPKKSFVGVAGISTYGPEKYGPSAAFCSNVRSSR